MNDHQKAMKPQASQNSNLDSALGSTGPAYIEVKPKSPPQSLPQAFKPTLTEGALESAEKGGGWNPDDGGSVVSSEQVGWGKLAGR
jgi:hypothetical protein